MDIKNVVVIGGGVLGSQIAFQSAFKGYNVKVWLRSEASIGRSKPKFERLYNLYQNDLEDSKNLIGKDSSDFIRGFFDDFSEITLDNI